MVNESKKTELEQNYAHAHNLANSFKDLAKLSDLFKAAVKAENYLAAYQQNIIKEEAKLKAVTDAVEKMDEAYSKRVEKMREMEEQTKQKCANMEKQWTEKYESDYGRRVKAAEDTLESIGLRNIEKEKHLATLEAELTDINNKISIREDHLGRLNEQLDALKKVLVD